jgi:hypothetical protein
MWFVAIITLCFALLVAGILWRSRGDSGGRRFGADAQLDAETVRHRYDPYH